MKLILANYVVILGWIFALVVIMSSAVVVMGLLLNHFSAELNVWKEIRRKNNAMALVLASMILGISIIVSFVH